ncbi:hypothetical protein DF182_22210 [Chitinophaga flava]|uniref:Uncharacterized protein n=1 Tax=Chitinophaga flava TaxID=2259036 RepID=A0A365XSB4_9BACT|nr:hypothetical protein DF182_22210 [Chitinophaga flava]
MVRFIGISADDQTNVTINPVALKYIYAYQSGTQRPAHTATMADIPANNHFIRNIICTCTQIIA